VCFVVAHSLFAELAPPTKDMSALTPKAAFFAPPAQDSIDDDDDVSCDFGSRVVTRIPMSNRLYFAGAPGSALWLIGLAG
jgi:hypothetical protein